MTQTTKTYLFLFAVSLAILLLGFWFFDRQGLLLAVILVLGLNYFVFFKAEDFVLWSLRAQRQEGVDAYGVHLIVDDLCKKMGMLKPRLYFSPMALPNILIVGLSPSQTSIVLSDQAITLLSRDELTAIIAQRLQLMMAGHVTFATVTAAIASMIFVTNDALCFVLSLGWLRHKKQIRMNPLSMLIQIVFFPLAGIFVWMGWFPHKELEADLIATKLTKAPQSLADALWKMDNYARSQPIGGNLATAHLFIVDPFREHPWSQLFSAHPEIKERIRRIIGRYPYN